MPLHPLQPAARTAMLAAIVVFTAAFMLFGAHSTAHAQSTTLVINEIDYDQPSTDGSEFVEIKNVSAGVLNLSGYNLELRNGSNNSQYQLFALPAVDVAPGGYFVVCGDPANVPNCDLDVSPNTNLIQNGAPDAAALWLGAVGGTLVDTVSYEGSLPAPYTEGSGTGLADGGVADTGISRFPDGVDTQVNNVDLSLRCVTPGLPNLSAATGCVAATAGGPLVINEIDYDQPGTDGAEFVEIANRSGGDIDLSEYALILLNGSGGGAAEYQRFALAGSLPSGGYYVVCADPLLTPNCDLDVSPDSNLIQNGAPDAAALVFTAGAQDGVTDGVSYEGSVPGFTETDGTGLTDSGADDFLGISRFADQADTDVNNVDLSPRCISPGAENLAQATACEDPVDPRPEFLTENVVISLADPAEGECYGPGDFLNFTSTITNSGEGDAIGIVYMVHFTSDLLGVGGSCFFIGGSGGTCSVADQGLTWTGDIPGTPSGDPDNVLLLTWQVRVRGGTKAGQEECGHATLFFDADFDGTNESMIKTEDCTIIDCPPTVDPNRQLDCQVHLPILNFLGQDDLCETWVEVQNVGPEFVKASLVTWGEPGFCPPQAAGPLKVECTGLIKPGSTWNLLGAQIPEGSKSGILFKFTAKQLTALGLDLGFDDIVADFMCETLFFGVVGDADDYRRFKKAYDEGLTFAGIPMDAASGAGILAVDVHRTCPGDVTPGVEVTSKYNGIAGTHLGMFDPVYGGYGYYVPLIYADKSGYNTIMYIQNGGLECTSIEIWFKQQDDCLRAKICDIATLAPGESYQMDANDCVGPDFQGNAYLRSTQPLGIAVDIIGHDVLMTYAGEPSEINYTFDPDKSITFSGNQVAFGPLIYSEYQGWDTGIQVQNLSPVVAAKVKVYFLDRSGDIITTLVDWICPRGSQTYFLPVIASIPGSWIGSVRVESQEWITPGGPMVQPPNIVGVVSLIKYSDAARTETTQAMAYNLLPEHKIFDWQIGANAGGLESGVGLIAIPSVLKDLESTGLTSEVAIANVVPKPGFTDFAIYLYDQNGLIDYVCQKLNHTQVEYIDLQTWGYMGPGFKGSMIISATFWEHEVFDETGFFLRNLVGLGAASVERKKTRLGEDVAGDEAAGSRGIPFRGSDIGEDAFRFGFMGPVPICPGLSDAFRPPFGECPDTAVATCSDCPKMIPDPGISRTQLRANVPANCFITDIDIVLDVQHEWIADLDVDLVSPGVDSIRSRLFEDICGNFDDMNVLLDDDAASPIGSVCASPLTGVFTSETGTALDAFDGHLGGGDWVLIIEDDFNGSSGQLQGAELRLKLDTTP